MNTFKEIMVLLKEKSGKKLTFRSVLAFLLVTVIVFFTVFTLFGTMRVEQMDEYLGEIPGIIKSRENELLMSRHIYEEDILSRAELGVIICQEESVFFTEAEMLQRVRNAVSADSVSLVNEQGARRILSAPASRALKRASSTWSPTRPAQRTGRRQKSTTAKAS